MQRHGQLPAGNDGGALRFPVAASGCVAGMELSRLSAEISFDGNPLEASCSQPGQQVASRHCRRDTMVWLCVSGGWRVNSMLQSHTVSPRYVEGVAGASVSLQQLLGIQLLAGLLTH